MMTPSPTIELARQLIRRPSLTPLDEGCQDLLAERLRRIGFCCEAMPFEQVSNLWATRGQASPTLVFAGHTDVVPTGPLAQWQIPPFAGEVKDGVLHGRGAADMKGSIASFITACERFTGNHPNHRGTLGLLITSDEEGPARWGTREVLTELARRDRTIDLCLVGEPTSVNRCADMIKIGRRGSLNGTLTVRGKQGHIAYPHQAENPLHTALPPLTALLNHPWDQGNDDFQPTSIQFSNIHGGTGARNVIPGAVEIQFNFRYSPETTAAELRATVDAVVAASGVCYELVWDEASPPYATRRGAFVDSVCHAVREITGFEADISTTGGTSDGRFIAATGAEVVELGPVNATIHQLDEQVSAADLDTLSLIYERILEKNLGQC